MTAQVRVHVVPALAVLGVVVGVLAMHALPTAHHGAAPLMPAAGAHGDHADPRVLSGAAEPAAAGALGALSLTAAKDCYGTCEPSTQSLLMVCAAVLLAAGVGLVLAAEARRRTTGGRTATPRPSYPRAAAVPRRVDPVTEFCVNRT